MIEILLFILSYCLFLILGIPIHELGHMLCGLMTGYKFSSFRLLSYSWSKENGKIVFRRSKGVAAGQCLMAPETDDDKFRFVLYNLGGGLANLLTALIACAVAIIFNNDEYLLSICIGCAAINIVLSLVNLIPMGFRLPNDGMNIVMALRSKEAKRGFYLMLFTNNEMARGKRYRDFEPELFSVVETADLTNYCVAYAVMCEAARLYDIGEYDESVKQYDRLNLDKLQPYYRSAIMLDILYYYILHKPDFDKARKIYTDKRIKPFLKMRSPGTTRVLSAYEYFVNADKKKAKRLLDRAKADTANFPNIGIRLMEQEYLAELENNYCML